MADALFGEPRLAAIPAEVADAIVAACDDILVRGRCLDQFPVDVYQGGATAHP